MQDVWVPALWLLEIGNLLLSAQRRKRITADKRREPWRRRWRRRACLH